MIRPLRMIRDFIIQERDRMRLERAMNQVAREVHAREKEARRALGLNEEFEDEITVKK